MTRPEMLRRINTLTTEQADTIHTLVLQGYGSSGIRFETGATLKQINAIFEWVSRYGRVVPQPETI
jgi:hypothetical protein